MGNDRTRETVQDLERPLHHVIFPGVEDIWDDDDEEEPEEDDELMEVVILDNEREIEFREVELEWVYPPENQDNEDAVRTLQNSPENQDNEDAVEPLPNSPENRHNEDAVEPLENSPENHHQEVEPAHLSTTGDIVSPMLMEGASQSNFGLENPVQNSLIPDSPEDLGSLLSNVLKEKGLETNTGSFVELLYLSQKTWNLYQMLLKSTINTIEEDLKKQQKWEDRMRDTLFVLRDIEVAGLPVEERAAHKERVTQYVNTAYNNIQLNGASKILKMVADMKAAVNNPVVFSLPPRPEPEGSA